MKHYLRFSLMLLLIMLMGGVSFAQETESFNFVGWNFEGASSGWTTGYSAHSVKGPDVTVNFLKASKQASTSTISDCPVTKGSDITVTLNNQETCTITSIELLLKQWGSKAQTVTLNTSADGKTYTKTTTTSSKFSLTASGLSAKAIKFTFSSTSNQVGVQSIKVTYTKSGSDKTNTTLSFGDLTSKTLLVGETFTATPTLKAGDTEITGKTLTYKSSDENVATVNDNGVVEAKKSGNTTITANFAGDDTYAGATASYTLTVYDPNKTDVTFDFQKPEDYGYGISSSSKQDGDVAVGGTIVSGIVTITNTKNGKTTTRFWNDGLRIYNGATLTFSVPAGYKIVSVVGNKSINITNANSNSVTYSVTTNTTLASLTVTYKENIDYTFDDTQDYTPVLDENKSVKIKRSMSADQLNTICLPFDLSEEQISTTFGSGTEVYEFLGVIDNVLHFSTTATMSATKPYLITPTETKSELIFSNIDVITDDAASKVTDGNFALCGTFGPATLKTDGTELFLAAGGILKKPAQGSNSKIKGFRAYFSVPANTNDAKISLGGFETSIDNISIDGMKLKDNQVYNLNGQLVGNSLNGLAKGIYLMNGKKYVVK